MSTRLSVLAIAVLAMLTGAAPAEAVVRASGELRRIAPTSYELTVNNTGDEPVHTVAFVLASGVRATSARTRGSECYVYVGEEDNSFICQYFALEPGGRRVFGFRTNRTYPASGEGVLAVYSATDSHRSVVTAPGGRPGVGRTELVRPVRGVVLVRRQGSGRFTRLRSRQLLPDRSEIDTRRGTAQITVAADRSGGLSTATVSEGRAIIDQHRARRLTTTLRLSEPLACSSRLATAAAAARPTKRRELFVKTKPSGKRARFKTHGNHAAATASGTAWRTTDTCTATTIKVTEGTVQVRDFRRRRTLDLTAPNSYTARRR